MGEYHSIKYLKQHYLYKKAISGSEICSSDLEVLFRKIMQFTTDIDETEI
jgi:hypothetical protein